MKENPNPTLESAESTFDKRLDVVVKRANVDAITEYHSSYNFQDLSLYYTKHDYDKMKVQVNNEFPYTGEEVKNWFIDNDMNRDLSLEFYAQVDERETVEGSVAHQIIDTLEEGDNDDIDGNDPTLDDGMVELHFSIHLFASSYFSSTLYSTLCVIFLIFIEIPMLGL